MYVYIYIYVLLFYVCYIHTCMYIYIYIYYVYIIAVSDDACAGQVESLLANGAAVNHSGKEPTLRLTMRFVWGIIIDMSGGPC